MAINKNWEQMRSILKEESKQQVKVDSEWEDYEEHNAPKLKVKLLNDKAIPPKKAHPYDAGFDLYSTQPFHIDAYERYIVPLGLAIEIPKNHVGFIKSRSGLMVRCGIITDGTIDYGYTGEIRVCLFNMSSEPYAGKKGERIAQLVILPISNTCETETVEELARTRRGINGFGSTGK